MISFGSRLVLPTATPWTASRQRLHRPIGVATRQRRVCKASESETWSDVPPRTATGFLRSPYDAEILRVALPALCAGLLGPICTAVDTAVVGQLGTLQLSGLGVGAVVYMFLSNLFLFVQFLVTPAVAKTEAKGETEKLSQIIGQSIKLTVFGGCLCGAIVFFLTTPIINMLHPPLQVRGFAVTYLRVMATSLPPFFLYQCLAGILRGLKDTFTIFKASGIATVANIILDVIFVYGFHWGVFGAAFATALCTFVSTGIMLHRVLSSGKVQMEHLWNHAPPTSSQGATKVLSDGIALIVRTLTVLSLIVVSSILIAQQGPIVHSAYELCRLVFLLGHVTYTAFDYTMQSLCASWIGKNDRTTARAILIRTLQMVFCLTALLSGSVFFFSSSFVRSFTSSVEVAAEFKKVALALLLPVPMGGLAAVLDGSLLGASRFKLVALCQMLTGSLGMALLFLFHHQQLLTLTWTALFVRVGLSAQLVVSAFLAFYVEYRAPK